MLFPKRSTIQMEIRNLQQISVLVICNGCDCSRVQVRQYRSIGQPISQLLVTFLLITHTADVPATLLNADADRQLQFLIPAAAATSLTPDTTSPGDHHNAAHANENEHNIALPFTF